jgi:S1-C subfamily serine protease
MALRRRIAGFYSRFQALFLIAAAVVVAVSSILVYDRLKPAPQRLTQRDINNAVERALDTAKPRPTIASLAYANIRPSIVLVKAGTAENLKDSESGFGTGVVIDERGIILTCLHVIGGSSNITVVFADSSESPVEVVLRQPENDLAVLRALVIPDDLVAATLADSASLRVGDEVFAVGHPYLIRNSLSAGVVSGLNRNFKSPKTGKTLLNLIQFDAAVNPGNSGGPLLNRDGEVVGIVTALLNPTDQDVFIGIGFAIPIETAGGAGGAPPV